VLPADKARCRVTCAYADGTALSPLGRQPHISLAAPHCHTGAAAAAAQSSMPKRPCAKPASCACSTLWERGSGPRCSARPWRCGVGWSYKASSSGWPERQKAHEHGSGPAPWWSQPQLLAPELPQHLHLTTGHSINQRGQVFEECGQWRPRRFEGHKFYISAGAFRSAYKA
jgi:hypothetical protein